MGYESDLPIHKRGEGHAHRANVEALRRFQILDTAPEAAFDHIVEIASRIFDVPTVLVSLIDLNRQWFKARVGLDVCETSLDVSFCAHAVLRDGVMVVSDATQDARFKTNPLVDAPDGIRFYAGAPLRTADGFTVGTLCLVDTKVRGDFSQEDRKTLAKMARLVVDVMEGRANHRASEEAQKKLQDFTSAALDVFWETDKEHRFSYFSSGASHRLDDTDRDAGQKFKDTLSAMLGQTRWEFLGADTRQEPWASHIDALMDRRPFRDLRYSVDIGGSTLFLSVSGQPVFDENGVFTGYRGATHDVTASELARIDTERLANSDPLTGLANRRCWNLELRDQLACKLGHPKSILLLDVDRFKDINDALGHDVGDALLVEIAKRIASCGNDAVLAARLGGDEFAILLSGDQQHAIRTSECILHAMERCFEIGGHSVHVEVSIGIRSLTTQARDCDEAMVDADLALRRAKSLGRDRYILFEPHMRSENDHRIAITSQLERALAGSELELFYQPQVRLSDDAIVGMEGLLRWNHPERGLLTPQMFLAALETSSFDIPVGQLVIDLACKQAKIWDENGTPVRIGINVSASQLYGDNLAKVLSSAMKRYGVAPDLLEIEVTERVALGNVEKIQWVLDEIRELGISIAFDDFGTGFASLSSLMQFPLDRVKIDRRFVCDLAENMSNARLVSGLVSLCHNLGFDVIAEGVETKEQSDFLRQHKCDEAQGYLYAKPLDAETATEFLYTWNRQSTGIKRVG